MVSGPLKLLRPSIAATGLYLSLLREQEEGGGLHFYISDCCD